MRPSVTTVLMALACVVGVGCGGGGAGDTPVTPVTPPPVGPVAAVPAGPFVPGQSYTGRNGYIEYVAGNAPVIFTAPHGGSLTPAEIPARGCGTNTTDLNTQELARAMQASFLARTGRYPHVVINRLSRSRLDANRDRGEATCGDAESAVAWEEWHAFVEIAKQAAIAGDGRGWYMDLHGHGHEIQRLELGYLLTDAQLALADTVLDAGAVEDASSIRTLARADASTSFSALLRGPTSLGALYAAEGFRSLPSPADRTPAGAPYFDGGYNTARHGCQSGGNVCGVQVEANFAGVRDAAANRTRFGDATARVLDTYLRTHWGLQLPRATP
jgi:hypothetical protein